MKKIIVLAILVGASAPAWAHQWSAVYSQNEQWVQETFQRADDGWQDRIKIQYFPRNGLMLPTESFLPQGRELLGLAQNGELWPGKEKWDLAWEERFSKWIAAETDSDFFQKHKIATDCADVQYALRWIFARINGLEMAVRLTGSGDYLTHRSVRNIWAGLPTAKDWFQDQRFLASLNYLLNNTYTHSLMADSYPIKIDRKSIRPGVYHLDLHDSSGHTQVIYRSDDAGDAILPFLVYQSTTPRAVRELMIDGFWYPMAPKEGKGGLLRMRWPEFAGSKVSLKSPEKMPFFSKEQYDENFVRAGQTYNQEVYLRLNPKLDMTKVVVEGYKSLQAMFSSRVKVVEEGYQFCSQNPCPEGSSGYEGWSTPSRDKKILSLEKQLQVILGRVQGDLNAIGKLLREDFLEINGLKYNLAHLLLIWKASVYSSDPRELPAVRWGISGLAFGDWLKSLFTSGVELRQTALDQGKDLAELDTKFAWAQHLASRFCSNAPGLDCDKAQETIQNTQVNLAGDQLTLREAVNRVPWMVSNAKVGLDQQWGKHSLQFNWLDASGSFDRIFQKEGYLLQSGVSSWRLFKQSSFGGTLILEGKNSIATLVDQGPSLLVYQNGEVSAYDLKGGGSVKSPLNFKATRALSFGNGFALVNESNEIALGVLNAGQIKWLDRRQAQWISSEALSFYSDLYRSRSFVYGTNSGSLIWDFSGSAPRSYLISSSELTRVAYNNDRAIGLLGVGLVLKAIGAFINSTEAMRAVYSHSSGESYILFNSNGTYEFAVLQADGQFRVKKILDGSVGVFESHVTLWSRGGGVQYFEWKAQSLDPIPLLADEERLSSALGGYYAAKLKNTSRHRIRKGNQEIFQTPTFADFSGMSLTGELYFEYLEETTGRLWVYSTADLSKPLMNSMALNYGYRWPKPLKGALTGSNYWLQ